MTAMQFCKYGWSGNITEVWCKEGELLRRRDGEHNKREHDFNPVKRYSEFLPISHSPHLTIVTLYSWHLS